MRMIETTVLSNLHHRLLLDERAVEDCIGHLRQQHYCIKPVGELSLVFVDDEVIAELHGRFMDDPTPTDVITFEGDADDAEPCAGEIVVSADHAAAYAEAHGVDFSRELTLYIVHGWLHLCGYDDLTDADRVEMRRAEAQAMQSLEAAHLIPHFELA